MCQATVYLGGQEIARDVTWLEQGEGSVHLATFFEEPRTVAGCIRHVDFLKHQVFLAPLGGKKMDETEKLTVLLPHWIEHTEEHAAEFHRWADRVPLVSEALAAAAESLERANEKLRVALEQLGGSSPRPKEGKG